jgi:hypothetical protein
MINPPSPSNRLPTYTGPRSRARARALLAASLRPLARSLLVPSLLATSLLAASLRVPRSLLASLRLARRSSVIIVGFFRGLRLGWGLSSVHVTDDLCSGRLDCDDGWLS